jgi:[ribosomal protein S5]-alanine N-acetyltransferase
VSARTIERIETARLVCERLRDEHAPEVAALMRDPAVARTLSPTGEPPSERQVFTDSQLMVAHWKRHGFGPWLLRDRAGTMVGRGGLQWSWVDGRRELEALWALVPERWGEGLASELAGCAIEVAFRDLGRDEIVAFTLPDNHRSRRVMEKTGFRHEREIVHAGLPHVLYRRRRDEA